MRRASLVVLCLLLAAPAALAQEPMFVTVTYIQVKPGMEAAFTAIAAEHRQWHEETGDTHYYRASQVLTGPRSGQYVFSAGPMTAARLNDYEEFLDADMADVAERGGMDMIAAHERMVVQTMPGLGNPPPPDHEWSLTHIWEIRVDGAAMPKFRGALEKMNAAQSQVEGGNHVAFTEMVSGGSPFTILMVEWSDGWMAPDMERERMVMEAAGGEEAYGEIMAGLTGSVHGLTVSTYKALPELSYPAPAETME